MKTSKTNTDFNLRVSSDDLNPELLLNGIATALLVDLAAGKIDAIQLAKSELANRGLDLSGRWIGFEAAKNNL